MNTKIEKRCGYFNQTGSRILSNGCIEFLHQTWPPVQFENCDPENVVASVRGNVNENGGEYNRCHYVESVNSWLKTIRREDLQIEQTYVVFTETKSQQPCKCKLCGKTWTCAIYTPDPDEKNWGLGVSPPDDVNYYREYVDGNDLPRKKIVCGNCKNLNAERRKIKNVPVIISVSGYQNGFGSDRYKSVAGLSKTERDHVKNGTALVLITSRPANGNSGTIYRIVLHNRFGYYPTTPSAAILERI